MKTIRIFTGSERHSSWGAYGRVKVLNGDNQLVPHYKGLAEDDEFFTDWDEKAEVGYQGKHGLWVPAELYLKDGTIIYVEGASTYKGRPSSKGRGWFTVDANAPTVCITTPGYSSRNLEVSGNLRRLDYAEQKELELPILIRRSKWLSVTEVENV